MTKGYTLAEVVISMLVIAVVASVCIKITKTKLDNITKVNYYVAYDTLRKAALEIYNNYKVCDGLSCIGGNELDTESCSCVCKQTAPSDIPCGQSWDAEQCQLVDIELPTCKSGYEFDETTCGCVKTATCSSSCNIDGVYIEGIGTLRNLGYITTGIDTCDGTSEWDPRFTSSVSRDCSNNFWAGAKKACADIGMELADFNVHISMFDALGCRPCSILNFVPSEYYYSMGYLISCNYNGCKLSSIVKNANLGTALCVGD